MLARTEPTRPTHRLAPLFAADADPAAYCPPAAARRVEEHWDRLRRLGFDLELQAHSLAVRNRNRGFEVVVQFSAPDDLGERRRLFRALKREFGGFWDHFVWIFQPCSAVTVPYEALRGIVDICETARAKASAAPPAQAC